MKPGDLKRLHTDNIWLWDYHDSRSEFFVKDELILIIGISPKLEYKSEWYELGKDHENSEKYIVLAHQRLLILAEFTIGQNTYDVARVR